MDTQWHGFSTWLMEAQLSMAKMTQERKVLEDRIASAQNRERDLAGELSSLQKQFKTLTDQQAKVVLKEKQAVYAKKALQQLVKAGTAASLGLINVKSSAAAAAAAAGDADAAEVAAMRHISKLPQLQAMMEEIETSSPLGDGLKQLEERVGAMNAKIRKVEAKEEQLICLVETTLEQLDAIYTVIDEVRFAVREVPRSPAPSSSHRTWRRPACTRHITQLLPLLPGGWDGLPTDRLWV